MLAPVELGWNSFLFVWFIHKIDRISQTKSSKAIGIQSNWPIIHTHTHTYTSSLSAHQSIRFNKKHSSFVIGTYIPPISQWPSLQTERSKRAVWSQCNFHQVTKEQTSKSNKPNVHQGSPEDCNDYESLYDHATVTTGTLGSACRACCEDIDVSRRTIRRSTWVETWNPSKISVPKRNMGQTRFQRCVFWAFNVTTAICRRLQSLLGGT